MTSDTTFNELSTLDGEFLPERVVLSAMKNPVNGLAQGVGKDLRPVVRPIQPVCADMFPGKNPCG